ncbi:MAG: HAD-IA family hydrolase [Verrucomicrobia bacterium]|nr:HAD-IA family hydrolase [Verrucomicrobiota bacterium]
MKIKVVTFDAAGTLISLTEAPGKTYADAAVQFGFALDPTLMQKSFQRVWKSAKRPADILGPRQDDGKEWWRDLVYSTLQHAGYSIEPFTQYFEAVYSRFTEAGVWRLYPGVQEALTKLHQANFRLGVISNFDRRLYLILEHLKILNLFEHIVISSEVGAEKPSGRIFEEAVSRFGVSKDELLHVGDDPLLDTAGAQAAGIKCLILDHADIDVLFRALNYC